MAAVPQEFAGFAPVSTLEYDLSEMEQATQETLHRFAENVMRPIGAELDRMSPEEVIAEGSPLWQYLGQFLELGFTAEMLEEMEPLEAARLKAIAYEELGWGDAGLSVIAGAGAIPQWHIYRVGSDFLKENVPETVLGCWGITEPDHGSDTLDFDGSVAAPDGDYGRPNCVVSAEGDEIVINGQKSAWVSNGPIAQACCLFAAFEGEDGKNGSCVVIVPLDADGVSRGKPLSKMGQRALPQGELFFDNVRLSKDYMIAGPDEYQDAAYWQLCEANAAMGALFVGVARAAFEHALAYAHERKQGGVPIIRHQNVRYRLFHMFRKVEAARALARRVMEFNATAPRPELQASISAKITSTQTAFEVASEALGIFGSNGVTYEYPMEKLLRDARASLIEDGCNEFLAIKGGSCLVNHDLL